MDYVNRVIRRHRGCTATDLLNDLRMELAGARLRHTSDNVQAIAESVGFSNMGHFYKLFTARYRMKPHAYRQAKR